MLPARGKGESVHGSRPTLGLECESIHGTAGLLRFGLDTYSSHNSREMRPISLKTHVCQGWGYMLAQWGRKETKVRNLTTIQKRGRKTKTTKRKEYLRRVSEYGSEVLL